MSSEEKKDDKTDEIVPKFDVTQEFIDRFKIDGRVIKLIRKHFTRLPGKYASDVFTNIFINQPIKFTD